MDILMGSAAVLAGAVVIAIVCMVLWATVRALGDGKFGLAVVLIAGILAGVYYGKQGYASAANHFTATDFTLDFRSPVRVAPGAWNADLNRMSGARNVHVTTRDDRAIRMVAQTIELRKRNDEVTSVWLCSAPLTSDDAADLVKTIAREFDLETDTLDAWADRCRHALDRDPHGWAIEKRRSGDYVKLTIDSDQHGFWWVGVMYAN